MNGGRKIAQSIYLVGVVAFAAGVVVQVFLAGAALLAEGNYLFWHRVVGTTLAWLPVALVVIGVVGGLPRRVIGLNALLWALMVLQFVFLHAIPSMGLPTGMRALHAVNALALFWVALQLAKAVWAIRRSG